MTKDTMFASGILASGVLMAICGIYTAINLDKFTFYVNTKLNYDKTEKDKLYTYQASKLVDYYYRQDIPVRFHVIKKTLEDIDYYLPQYFPDGPFTSRDFIAIAMVESRFNQYLVGTSGEKGIFQIMEESSKYMGVKKNQFDIDINTELSMFVLSEKFKKHQDYRKAIIAYNGVVVSNGKWSDTYWKKFSKERTTVDVLFKERGQ